MDTDTCEIRDSYDNDLVWVQKIASLKSLFGQLNDRLGIPVSLNGHLETLKLPTLPIKSKLGNSNVLTDLRAPYRILFHDYYCFTTHSFRLDPDFMWVNYHFFCSYLVLLLRHCRRASYFRIIFTI